MKIVLKNIQESFMDIRTIRPLLIGIVVSLIIFFFPLSLFYSFIEKDDFNHIRKDLIKFDSSFDRINDHDLLRYVENPSTDIIERIDTSIVTFQIYATGNQKKLLFFSKRSPILPFEVLNNDYLSARIVKIQNHFYLIRSRAIGNYKLIGLLDLDNYLASRNGAESLSFLDKFNSRKYELSLFASKSGHQFVNNQGEYLFTLKKSKDEHPILIIIGICLVLFALYYLLKAIYSLCKLIASQHSFLASLLFFSIIYLVRLLCLKYQFPSIIYDLRLFSPTLYKGANPSLGDLFIFVLSTQMIVVFIRKYLRINYSLISKLKLHFVIHTLTITILLGEAFSMSKIFYGLVVESSIWFNFNYFPRLSIYSFIGLSIMLMTFYNYYILSNFLIKIIARFKLSKGKILYSLFLNIAMIVSLYFFAEIERKEIFLLFGFLICFLSIAYYFYYFEKIERSHSIMIFLFFASSVTTFLLYVNNTRKDQKIMSSIASNIAFDRNVDLKNKLDSLLQRNACNQEFISKTDLGHEVLINEISSYDFQEDVQYKDIQYNRLTFINRNTDNHYVYAVKCKDGYRYFTIYLRNYLNNKELSSRKKIQEIIVGDANVSYALYDSNQRIRHYGKYNYPPYFEDQFFQSKLGFQHQIFRQNHTQKVIITTSEFATVSIITQFAYIFFFNLLLFFIFEIVTNVLRFGRDRNNIFKSASLSNKIMFSIMVLVMVIFTMIAIVSYHNLEGKSEGVREDRIKTELQLLKVVLESSTSVVTDFNKILSGSFHEYHDRREFITLYNEEGISISGDHLITLDPKYIIRNHKNKLDLIYEVNKAGNQLDIIQPIQKERGYIYVAYHGLLDLESKTELTQIMVSLVNVYIILFLVAMLFAFWMANVMTKPLRLIANKLPYVKLGEKNEYLRYEYNDELGDLVRKYNSMLDQIEHSTRQLVFNEREEAWTQMAKQIAHEIKNPLTPMKLKIQFLENKIREGKDDTRELTLNVAKTLIEQINNLDTIATSFSDFAKLHQPKLEDVNWIEIIHNVSSVFSNQNSVINFNTQLDRAMISCDVNQMVSCLNNLIKNAIQSYPDGDTPLVDINLEVLRNQYLLTIQDKGKGISTENYDKIFTPNFTTKTSGSGLGLPITYRIIQSFQGELGFYSKINIGTTFHILLPICQSYLNQKKYSLKEKKIIEKEMIDLANLDVYIDLKYASEDNIFRKILYTDISNAFLHKDAFKKMKKAIDLLKSKNSKYRFIIWDALRPHAIQKAIWDHIDHPDKEDFIASPDKVSLHNYGMAVDLGIVKIDDQDPSSYHLLDFGCSFDEFSELAQIDYMLLDDHVIDNRILLKDIMVEAGFYPYAKEWWHFEAYTPDFVRQTHKYIE